ncbi:anthrax toxin-like adenylyl cyclase domain-containing protein [Paraburkholderia aspalathi]|uniref:anthrax toxin-like adenylyl cyclase domain-containing protein n=1 Tax=Paraburkholderia aspalathi TaxID=1324617 RepID=UPI0038B7CF8A
MKARQLKSHNRPASSRVRVEDEDVEGLSGAARTRPPVDIQTGAALPGILFQEAFQQVANERDVVIGIREPNALGAPLLLEGYASKSFYIKAKSSVSGPTAGFVAMHPAFGKLGAEGEQQQQEYIDKTLLNKAGKVPLRLSDQRVEELRSQQLMSPDPSDTAVSADYGSTRHEFTLQRRDDVPDLPWAVLHRCGEPVDILSNPERIGGPVGAKAAVTADYDLFGLFPRLNRAYNIRPLNPVARLVGRNIAGIKGHANAYLDKIRCTGRDEDPDLGNMHFYGQTIKDALNARIKLHGYSGGILVHHNDESGNPFSPGQDFPIRFIVPCGTAILVRNRSQLLSAYRWFRNMGYHVEINPAFAFPSYRA